MGYQPYGEYCFRIKVLNTVSGINKIKSDSLSNAQLTIKKLKLKDVTEYVDDVQPSKYDESITTPPKKP